MLDVPAKPAARFITFEGGEGVGKSTQVKRLLVRLNRMDIEAVRTREPGGTPKAEAVRAFMPFILEKLGVDRLYGVCRADNAASCRVLERSGYLLAEEAIGPYLGQETLVRRYIYQG